LSTGRGGMRITFLGAAGEVTGSCYLIEVGRHRMLLECGLFQGRHTDQKRNDVAPPVPAERIDAVVLSHAHIDHSGRLPWLHKLGFRGPIHTHHASRALCEIMLRDSAYLQEKDAEWDNKKRRRKGLADVTPLYTIEDAEAVMGQFEGADYGELLEILPGIKVRFNDAGHILGSAIVELWLHEGDNDFKLVFSGDLGHRGAPVMEEPANISAADLVLMESTYGDRNHRSHEATVEELTDVFAQASENRGNILIPAFAVGRTQDLLYLMEQNFERWELDRWDIFLDSPMAIEATEIYYRYRHLYGAKLFRKQLPALPNVTATPTTEQSMQLNTRESGAIIIAGSGMCTGGRILHHLKHNVWKPGCHVVIVGYQAAGTIGRRLVDRAEHIRLWHETIRVNAKVHTVGGLSAHADQSGLVQWYGHFDGRPPLTLVHGEPHAQAALSAILEQRHGIRANIARPREQRELV
jgi:metallo-beta-lactamase family protein